MPTFDFSKNTQTSDGSDAKREGKTFTIKTAFEEALLSDYNDGRQGAPDPGIRAKRFKLWRKLTRSRNDNGKVDLTVDEAKTLHDCAASWPTLVYGQLLEVLDGPGDEDGGGGTTPAPKPN